MATGCFILNTIHTGWWRSPFTQENFTFSASNLSFSSNVSLSSFTFMLSETFSTT